MPDPLGGSLSKTMDAQTAPRKVQLDPRVKKRLIGVALVKESSLYEFYHGPSLPIPDPHDASISKRKWEKLLSAWRRSLQAWHDQQWKENVVRYDKTGFFTHMKS